MITIGQRILKLSTQYENNLFVEDLQKTVMLCLSMERSFWKGRKIQPLF